MNPDIGLKRHCGKMDGKHIHRHRNLRKVSAQLDPDELDQLASHEAMRAKGAGWRTDFGPDTHVMVKFLDHRVGRKWDKVFSEVSHAFGVEGREWARREVLTHTQLDAEGRIVVNDTPWCGLFLSQIGGVQLYVHPTDGVLRRAGKPYSHHLGFKTPPTAVLIGGLAYFTRDGLWFSTPVVRDRDLVERLRSRGATKGGFDEAYQELFRRIRHLPGLWTPATGSFCCDPDATRQVNTRRVIKLGLERAEIAAAA